MSPGRARTWLVRIGAGLLLGIAAGGIYAGLNWTSLSARYAAHQLRTAASEDERNRVADRLVALGAPGYARLGEIIRGDNDPSRVAAAAAVDRFMAGRSVGDPAAVLLAGHVLAGFPQAQDGGKRALLGLISVILKQTGPAYASYCREAVAAGLELSDVEARKTAVRLAVHPDIKLRKELLPLLHDPEAGIRAAALFGVAMAAEEGPLVADEDLFPWLHDPDAGVRKVCYDALVSRERTEVEIALGRRLTHPEPAERLKLLMDLRYEEEIPDAEPWLERLSRDLEPAIRAGAARVALEVTADRKQVCPGWVTRLTEADPDPMVRRVATFFRKESLASAAQVRQAGGP